MKADDAVVRDFLDRARVARLATRSPKGAREKKAKKK